MIIFTEKFWISSKISFFIENLESLSTFLRVLSSGVMMINKQNLTKHNLVKIEYQEIS